MPGLYGRLEPFTDADYRRLHEATLSILEKVGLYVDHHEVLERSKLAGARVDFDTKIVKFPGDLIECNLKNCKNSLDRRPRPKTMRFSCDGGSGFVHDYESGKRRGATVKDLQDFCRLLDALENIDETSFPIFPSEVPYLMLDLVINRHTWANTFKGGGGGLSRNGCVCFNITPPAIDYLIRLARVKYQAETRPDGHPLISGFIGASSPLRYDESILECMLKLAKHKQVVAIGSNVLGGAQAPVTLAATVAMENAERLGGLSLLMAVDPNAYVYFVNHPSFMDMTCGNVANGSPEHSLMAMCATGLLRWYGFQLMANHPVVETGGQLPGTQAAVEKALHAMISGLSGASGVCACGSLMDSMSYEQLVIDNEIAGMVKHYLRGLDISDETIRLDVIEEMGIGGSFLEHPSVAEKVRSVYWQPSLWNRQCYSEWFREGAKDVLEKAHARVEHILATHHPRPLTKDQEDQMDEILKEAFPLLAGGG